MGETETATVQAADLMRKAFDAVAAKDLHTLASLWDDETYDYFYALDEKVQGPTALRAFFSEIFEALPDMRFTVEEILPAGPDIAVGRWRMQGTFSGGPYQGIEPNGRSIDLHGVDIMRFEDGILSSNHVYYDGLGFARQIGLLPPADSTADRAILAGFNALTKAKGAVKDLLER